MKDILFVTYCMGCGGAEKSLISLLRMLPAQKWNIDLLVASPNGVLSRQIPETVHQIDGEYEFENAITPIAQRRKKICNLRDLAHQLIWLLSKRREKRKNPNLNQAQLRWKIWGRHIPALNKSYDLAISYICATNHYVMDKVTASKKVLWLHNDFEKLAFDPEFERPYYTQADRIITISQSCVDSFLRFCPEYADKTMILENISSQSAIQNMAQDKEDDPFFDYSGLKFVTVGRLNDQKGLDMAIDAAKILKDKGLSFLWYVLGEGELRRPLEEQIERHGLTEEFKLVGLKHNPYPYVAACDIFVQPSRYEGKSIALDEAKILCRPILVTNYATVGSSIENDVNGRIVEMTPQAIADGLYDLSMHESYRTQFVKQLQSEHNGNEEEIDKYIALIEQLLSEDAT